LTSEEISIGDKQFGKKKSFGQILKKIFHFKFRFLTKIFFNQISIFDKSLISDEISICDQKYVFLTDFLSKIAIFVKLLDVLEIRKILPVPRKKALLKNYRGFRLIAIIIILVNGY